MMFQKKKQIFKLSVLKKLLTEENNCISLVATSRLMALPPFFLNDVKGGIFFLLNSILKKYDQNLDGILIGYQNVKILMDDSSGLISMGGAETRVNISVEFYIFQPKIGGYLLGVVNKISSNHIGCLVHQYFNATILKPDNIDHENWICKDLKVNDKITFKVKDLDFSGLLPYIEGTLDDGVATTQNQNDINNDHDLCSVDNSLKEILLSKADFPGEKTKSKNDLEVNLEGSVNYSCMNESTGDGDIYHNKQKKKRKKEKDLSRLSEESSNQLALDDCLEANIFNSTQLKPTKKQKIKMDVEMCSPICLKSSLELSTSEKTKKKKKKSESKNFELEGSNLLEKSEKVISVDAEVEKIMKNFTMKNEINAKEKVSITNNLIETPSKQSTILLNSHSIEDFKSTSKKKKKKLLMESEASGEVKLGNEGFDKCANYCAPQNELNVTSISVEDSHSTDYDKDQTKLSTVSLIDGKEFSIKKSKAGKKDKRSSDKFNSQMSISTNLPTSSGLTSDTSVTKLTKKINKRKSNESKNIDDKNSGSLQKVDKESLDHKKDGSIMNSTEVNNFNPNNVPAQCNPNGTSNFEVTSLSTASFKESKSSSTKKLRENDKKNKKRCRGNSSLDLYPNVLENTCDVSEINEGKKVKKRKKNETEVSKAEKNHSLRGTGAGHSSCEEFDNSLMLAANLNEFTHNGTTQNQVAEQCKSLTKETKGSSTKSPKSSSKKHEKVCVEMNNPIISSDTLKINSNIGEIKVDKKIKKKNKNEITTTKVQDNKVYNNSEEVDNPSITCDESRLIGSAQPEATKHSVNLFVDTKSVKKKDRKSNSKEKKNKESKEEKKICPDEGVHSLLSKLLQDAKTMMNFSEGNSESVASELSSEAPTLIEKISSSSHKKSQKKKEKKEKREKRRREKSLSISVSSLTSVEREIIN